MTATLDDEVADLRRANAELQRRLGEALAERDEAEAQKAAMAEILEVKNIGYLVPVFDVALERRRGFAGPPIGNWPHMTVSSSVLWPYMVNCLRRDRSLNREQAQQRKICGHLLSVDNKGRFDDRW